MLVKLFKKSAAQVIAMIVRSGWPRLGKAALALEQTISPKRRSQHLLTFMSVAAGASLQSARMTAVIPARTLTLQPVRRVGTDADKADRKAHPVDLPELVITEFRDIQIIGGTEMLCMNDDILLYDEMALGDPEHYGRKAFGIMAAQTFGKLLPACYQGRVLISCHRPEKDPIPKGIHLCKDHSVNYFHWLFECLPRAIVAIERTEYSDFPLLIDDRLPAQNLQALEQIAAGREIVRIGHRDVHRVGELVFPGVFSFMHDNYDNEVSADDLLIAPEAVQLLRRTYLPAQANEGRRKLFVARDGAKYRLLRNELQLQSEMAAQGFEIVHPERLDFVQQVELFSAASVIAGPTGAGLSNMVFAPEGCKVIVLAGATNRANYFIFSQLAQWLKHELIYVTGPARRPARLHSDYDIDPADLHQALKELGVGVDAAKDSAA
ncbi:MAG: glycosyltransferase family 61 protein [Gammaproteobacteria bacterium]|nr:glycosyltransferase family 61 protein [Sideroxydans sp.]MBU3903134.1 glycosyltransferase family 61 protein [Gammaproteobacteria bacterium]MBU4044843.1 glycosyltransferase family 61 protein [Gammaproteobacteria bacterium]